MTGIVGGVVTGERLDRMAAELAHEPWYDSDRFEAGPFGLVLTHHGDTDPEGHAVWTDGRRAGVVDGAITNLDELGWGREDVFERLLRAPERTLAALEGPFTVACVDAGDDRALLATDKIGCRIPFYSTERGLVFGSRLAALARYLDDPTVDHQGVSDLLLMGNMWGDTTLLEGVRALHPATVLEYREGRLSESRYWEPTYAPADPTDEYLHGLTTRFQRAVDRTAGSVSGDVGLWLSGGLDSRATANELARHADSLDSLVTYTYDANPGGGVNPRLAGATADALEVDNETVPLTVESFREVLASAVDVTDGMVKWNTLVNLSAVHNVRREADVIMEGLEGALVGHHVCRHHLSGTSLAASMYRSEAALSAEDVDALTAVEVDPFGSLRAEARRIDQPTFEQRVVDAHFQNYYGRFAHASNALPRTQVGTRVPYADGPFLEHVARLPTTWRMGALPFSDGELIYGVVKPKLRMIRSLNADLARIPYERSRLKPTRPYPLHVAGFFGATALAQLRSKPTYGGRGLTERWYGADEAFRSTLDGLLDDACDRPFLDTDAVRDRGAALRDTGRGMNAVSAITTLEIWLQRHLD